MGRLSIEKIEEFERACRIPPSAINENVLRAVTEMDEDTEIERGFRQILSDHNRTPHNSAEIADIVTSRVTIAGASTIAAFVIKGKSFPRVSAKLVGHQLTRLMRLRELDVVLLVCSGDIQDDVYETLANLCASHGWKWCVIDAEEIARLFIVEGLICTFDGGKIIQGKCCNCGEVADDVTLQYRIADTPHFELVEQRDISVAGVFRNSVRVVTNKHYNRKTIREVAELAGLAALEAPYTSKDCFAKEPLRFLIIFIYQSNDDLRKNNWVCRVFFRSEDLTAPSIPDAAERCGQFMVDWADPKLNAAVEEFTRNKRIPKGDWVRMIRHEVETVDRILVILKSVGEEIARGAIPSPEERKEFVDLEKLVSSVADSTGYAGWPPLECEKADLAFRDYVGRVHDLLLPFAYWNPRPYTTDQIKVIFRTGLLEAEEKRLRLRFAFESL